jgi:hypothetical protein
MRGERLLLFVIMVALFGLPLAGYLVLLTMADNQSPISAPGADTSWPPAAALSSSVPAPILPPYDTSWPGYRLDSLGIIFHYPPQWEPIEAPSINGIIIFPQGEDHQRPLGVISLAFVADSLYRPGVALRSSKPANQGLGIDGRAAQWYEDPINTIPAQSLYVEIDHRGGTLVVSATEGPRLNLVPTLLTIIGTIELN